MTNNLCINIPVQRKNRSPCLREYIHKSLRVAGWMAYFLLCNMWMSSLRQQKQQREPVTESQQDSQHKWGLTSYSKLILTSFVEHKPNISIHLTPSKKKKQTIERNWEDPRSTVALEHTTSETWPWVFVLAVIGNVTSYLNKFRYDWNTAGISYLKVNLRILSCRIHRRKKHIQ